MVQLATVGEVVAEGATLATIRERASTTLTTWVSPVQLSQICLGSQASVQADWMAAGQRLGAVVTLIGDRADYPPTSFATDEVHLTRAVPVRLTLSRSSDQPQSLPAGAPVDIQILRAAHDDSCSVRTTSR